MSRDARILIALAACGSPQAPIAHHATTHSKRELAGYPSVVEPTEVSCKIDGPWAYGQPDSLRFRDGGPVYATVTDPKVAHLELGGVVAFVEIETPAVRLWGFVDHDTVALHAARPFLIADYLAPGPHAALYVKAVTSSGISVALLTPSYMKAVAVPRGLRTCSDLSLAEVVFDPRAAIGDDHHTSDELAAGIAIPLSTRADAPAVAQLHFDDPPPVDVIERRGNVARVVLDTYGDPGADTLVVGWVPQSAVKPSANGHAINDSRGGGRGGARGRPRGGHAVQCRHEVPLVVELGGERHLVGAIAPGVVIGELASAGDFVEITLERTGLRLADTARSLTKVEALGDCEAAPP